MLYIFVTENQLYRSILRPPSGNGDSWTSSERFTFVWMWRNHRLGRGKNRNRLVDSKLYPSLVGGFFEILQNHTSFVVFYNAKEWLITSIKFSSEKKQYENKGRQSSNSEFLNSEFFLDMLSRTVFVSPFVLWDIFKLLWIAINNC